MRLEFYGWNDTDITNIVQTCTILHNMLVILRLSGELNDELDENGCIFHPAQVEKVSVMRMKPNSKKK